MEVFEIVFLALLAGFIALRLVSVLGRRTGNEKPLGEPYAGTPDPLPPVAAKRVEAPASPRAIELPADLPVDVSQGLRAIADADAAFDANGFLVGARAAYRMILELFWAGDLEALKPFVADDVMKQFEQATQQRLVEGRRLDNAIRSIESARIVHARLNGSMAEISVRFDALLTAVTRDAGGTVIAGEPDSAIATHDVWAFSRYIRASDPNWLLTATDSDE